MASRATVLLITAAIAVVVVGAQVPATAPAEEEVATAPAEEEEEDGPYIIKVGDDDGWDLKVDYNEWVKYETFNVGDNLWFKYSTQQPSPHNVVWLMDQASYDSCTVPPSNSETMTSGDDLVPLQSAGQYYFFSSLNGDCKDGMKLAINVAQ